MSDNRCLIIGSNGQLGFDIVRNAPENCETIPLTHNDIEICNFSESTKIIESIKPTHVIDLAAFHQTDICEEEVEKSFAVNCYAVRNLSQVCSKIGAALIFLSTDYVFSGEESRPFVEEDSANPINVYGISKRAGENMVMTYADHFFIFRVSGLYGVAGSSGKGGNFIETMLNLARAGKTIKVVSDQILTPTNTKELSSKIWEILNSSQHGLYHVTNTGECSWYDFAKEIFSQMRLSPDLSPQSTVESGATAQRPFYSVLDNKRLREIGLEEMKHWSRALNDYLVEKHNAVSINERE